MNTIPPLKPDVDFHQVESDPSSYYGRTNGHEYWAKKTGVTVNGKPEWVLTFRNAFSGANVNRYRIQCDIQTVEVVCKNWAEDLSRSVQ